MALACNVVVSVQFSRMLAGLPSLMRQ